MTKQEIIIREKEFPIDIHEIVMKAVNRGNIDEDVLFDFLELINRLCDYKRFRRHY